MKQEDWKQELRERLDTWQEPVPESLWDAISERLAESDGTQSAAATAADTAGTAADTSSAAAIVPLLRRRLTAAAAIVLLIVVGGGWLYRHNTMPDPASPDASVADHAVASLAAEKAAGSAVAHAAMKPADASFDTPRASMSGQPSLSIRPSAPKHPSETIQPTAAMQPSADVSSPADAAQGASQPSTSAPSAPANAASDLLASAADHHETTPSDSPDTMPAEQPDGDGEHDEATAGRNMPDNKNRVLKTTLDYDMERTIADDMNDNRRSRGNRFRMTLMAINNMVGGNATTEPMLMASAAAEPAMVTGNVEPLLMTDCSTTTDHKQPVSFGMLVGYRLGRRLSLESGLTYTYLRTDFIRRTGPHRTVDIQRLHYVGIPLHASLDLVRFRPLTLYYTMGGEADFCVSASMSTGSQRRSISRDRVCFSLFFSLGMRCDVGSGFNVFGELGEHYTIDNGNMLINCFDGNKHYGVLRMGVGYSF